MSKKKKIVIGVSVAFAVAVIAVLAGCIFGIVLPEKRKKAEWNRLVQEYIDNKIALYEEENAKYADYEMDVAFVGDSLTDGYDVQKYYPQFSVANRGISGNTTFDVGKRLDVSVYDLKPKVVVLLIGGNNLKTMFDNYETLLEGLKTHLPNTEVVLVSLTAMGRDWAEKNQIAALNNVAIKLLAEKYGFTFVDMFTPLFDVNTGEIRAEYTTDGAHLTPQGYTVFTETLTPVLEQLLEKWVS